MYFNAKYNLKLLITSLMAFPSCSLLFENLDFLDFLQKQFYNIEHRTNAAKLRYLLALTIGGDSHNKSLTIEM